MSDTTTHLSTATVGTVTHMPPGEEVWGFRLTHMPPGEEVWGWGSNSPTPTGTLPPPCVHVYTFSACISPKNNSPPLTAPRSSIPPSPPGLTCFTQPAPLLLLTACPRPSPSDLLLTGRMKPSCDVYSFGIICEPGGGGRGGETRV